MKTLGLFSLLLAIHLYAEATPPGPCQFAAEQDAFKRTVDSFTQKHSQEFEQSSFSLKSTEKVNSTTWKDFAGPGTVLTTNVYLVSIEVKNSKDPAQVYKFALDMLYDDGRCIVKTGVRLQ